MKILYLVIVVLAFTACSKSGNDSSPAQAITSMAFPTAEAATLPECSPSEQQSVIWVKDTGVLMFCGANNKWTEISVAANSINAKNVVLGTPKLGLDDSSSKTVGYLTATNLQQAMSVVAMDLSTVIPGSTWTAVNKSQNGQATGTVTFAQDGSIQVTAGIIDALGISSDHCGGNYDPDDSYTYEVVSGGVIMVNASTTSAGAGVNGHTNQEYLIKVTAQDANTILVMGYGACGTARDQLSILTRVQAQ